MKKGTGGTWQIRTCIPKDLKNLVTTAKIAVPVIATHGWRIVVNASQMARVFEVLATSIVYDIFQVGRCFSRRDCSLYPPFKFFTKITRRVPNNMAVLAGIEMRLTYFIFAASENHWTTKAHH